MFGSIACIFWCLGLVCLTSWDYGASYAPFMFVHDSAQRFCVTIEVVGYQIDVVFARCDSLCHEGERVE